MTAKPKKARYIMIGGFLGAGKTTAILGLARHLKERGVQVGLITNDQSIGLVDTALLQSQGMPVEEITGGCFCCRFQSLMDAAGNLTQAAAPDVFIAEPVGSCTDLRAAVSYPLRRIYGEEFEIAPLSVLVDPVRAMRILGLADGKAFSEKVLYVYGKQLEEADFIVINKADLLDEAARTRLEAALAEEFPCAEILTISARTGEGVEEWYRRVLEREIENTLAPEVDYEIYAEGEALLGWLNATASIEAAGPFDGNDLLQNIAVALRERLASAGAEIAHLKMTLTPDEGNDLAVLNLVRGDGPAENMYRLQEDLEAGELILNLRAEGDPEMLRDAVEAVLQSVRADSSVKIDHIEAFRPGKPTPTHRMAMA
jgi:G3E family GTPase